MARPFGNYLLLRRLATGGMGEVFLARPKTEKSVGERLVIKRILPHLAEDSEFRDMFLDEAKITTQFKHPNLVRIFEVGEVGDAVYLAMEFVHGEDLRSIEHAAKLKPLQIPLAATVHIVGAAAAGLEHAHGLKDARGTPLNLVHRDVSPQNILVGFGGEVKLIDFGVAKVVGMGQPTITGVLKGKCAYMSPEQAAGETIDARSDVFSLGVVFWELLTGRRLFKGNTDQMTMRLVLHCQVPPPSRLNPSLPAEVDALVSKALAKERDARFKDARSFRLALEKLGGSAEAAGKLVRELFPARYAEPDEGTDEAANGKSERPDVLPGEPGGPKPRNLPGSAARADNPRENTLSVTISKMAPKGKRWPWAVGAGAALLLLLGLLAFFARGHF